MEDVDVPITGAELSGAAKFFGWLLRRRPDPVSRLRHSEAMRDALRAHLPAKDSGEADEVIVVKLGKERKYGSADVRFIPWGSSAWHKFEVKGVEDQGLEVIVNIIDVCVKRGKAWRDHDETPGAQTVYLVGRIPYERIKHVDWKPDPYYSSPRLYVKYGSRGPSQELLLYEMPRSPSGFLYELHGIHYKGERGLKRRIRSRTIDFRLGRETRRTQREFRDGSTSSSLD
jgi:hypothetical protein